MYGQQNVKKKKKTTDHFRGECPKISVANGQVKQQRVYRSSLGHAELG